MIMNIEEFEKSSYKDIKWFIDLIKKVKNLKDDKGIPITDILIRENEYIYVSILKSFQPIKDISDTYKDFKPTKRMIIQLISAIGKETDMGIGMINANISEKDPMSLFARDTILDFSFILDKYGIYRFNVSYSEDGLKEGIGITIRILDYKIPTFDDVFYPMSVRKKIGNRTIPVFENYKNFIYKLASPQKIRLEDEELKIIDTQVVRSGGLILHVGATGSGKTTSIAAEIGYLAKNTSGIILTYENPIEYRYKSNDIMSIVRQFELGNHIKDDKNIIFKHLLRSNPSVVFYGEARTIDEVKMITEIANRGHLVFSTIHASSIKDALGILMLASKNEHFLVANSLLAIVAHKLVLNDEGEIVPIFEIFAPDNMDRGKIAENNLKDVYKKFYTEQPSAPNLTFKNCLHIWEHYNVISKTLKDEIEKNLIV